jgi:hypothetical protein
MKGWIFVIEKTREGRISIKQSLYLADLFPAVFCVYLINFPRIADTLSITIMFWIRNVSNEITSLEILDKFPSIALKVVHVFVKSKLFD